MLIFTQVPDSLIYDTVKYECDKITGEINKQYNLNDDTTSWSYMYLYNISKKFKVNTCDNWATFSIRTPGYTIGHITCDAFGRIIESEFYPSNKLMSGKNIDVFNNIFKSLIGESIDTSILAEIQFVQDNLRFNNKANKQILYFIANFIYHNGIEAESIIMDQFRAGYCLHFAMILSEMFKSGEVCWCAPFGHMVYVHNGIPYDIEGVNDSDCDYYIPISYIKKGIKDFMHVPGVSFNASEEYIQNAIKKYKKDNNL